MAVKKYLSLDRLEEYDELIKGVISTGDDSTLASAKSYADGLASGKANSSHTHDDRYYTESEIDTKISAVNTSITNITSGTTVVKKAEQAETAGSATTATTATTAGSATKATQDASGNVITSTYETKADASAKLDEAKAYADGLVGEKADEEHTHSISDVTNLQSSLDAKVPTSRTINGKALSGNITLSASDVGAATSGHTHDSYVNQNAFSNVKVGSTTVAADTTTDTLEIAAGTGISVTGDATNDKVTITNSGVRSIATGTANGTISVNTNGSSANVAVKGLGSAAYTASTAYDAAGTAQTKADAALSSAKSYTDGKISALLDGADDTTLDSIKELADAIKTNDSAIDALNDIASGKANADHDHAIADVSGLQSALDGKAASSHGTHVTYSTTAPVMDGTASVGSASTVARSDHKHPTDTSRASKTEFDTHVADTTKHITSTERTNWGAAYTHSQAAHAPSNAEKNQNAFSNIVVGGTTIAADTTTDSLTLVGSNVTITPDATNDKVTIAVASGSTSTAGILKLTNSTSSTSTTTAATPSNVKSAYDLANTAKTNAATAQTRADAAYSLAEGKVDSLSDLGITATAAELNYVDGVTSNVQTQLDGKAASGHGHNAATTSANGFMTSDMVTKLNGIATGANKTTVDSTLSTTSTNPVQNKVVNSAITTLTSTVSANTSSISAHSTAISNLQTAVSEIQEITSAEIQALFA